MHRWSARIIPHCKTGLTASVGMAHNRFLAKSASEAQKPEGLVYIAPDEVLHFLDPMPVSRR